jgi:hypothetical protein
MNSIIFNMMLERSDALTLGTLVNLVHFSHLLVLPQNNILDF